MNTLTGKAKAFLEDTVPGWVTCARCGGTMPRENMDAHKCIYAKQDNAAAALARIAELRARCSYRKALAALPALLRIAEAVANYEGLPLAVRDALEAFGRGE